MHDKLLKKTLYIKNILMYNTIKHYYTEHNKDNILFFIIRLVKQIIINIDDNLDDICYEACRD